MSIKIDSVAHTNEASIGHAGLSLIGEMARISCLDNTCVGVTGMKQPQISDPDILRRLCGLIAQGKTDFGYVRQFVEDLFLQGGVGVNRTTSSRRLRQRFEQSGFQSNS